MRNEDIAPMCHGCALEEMAQPPFICADCEKRWAETHPKYVAPQKPIMVDARKILLNLVLMAGCRECHSYAGVRCRACTWNDAMDIVEDAIDENSTIVNV